MITEEIIKGLEREIEEDKIQIKMILGALIYYILSFVQNNCNVFNIFIS